MSEYYSLKYDIQIHYTSIYRVIRILRTLQKLWKLYRNIVCNYIHYIRFQRYFNNNFGTHNSDHPVVL